MLAGVLARDAAAVADPVGVVLAGGRARRLGGASKACVELAGRPLVCHALAALAPVCGRAAVICKAATQLPQLSPGVERWDEDDEPRHPGTGIACALERAPGAVLVLATDMPFVGPQDCERLLVSAGEHPDAAAVIAAAAGRSQPVFGLYRPAAAAALRAAAAAGERLTGAVEALQPTNVALDPGSLRGINTPAELAAAQRALSGA